MKMKMKKIVSVSLAVLICSSILFTGCSQKTSNEKNQSSNVKLIWYYPNSPQTDQEEVFAQANKIIKEKLNVQVEFKPVDWGIYDEKMKVAIAAQEPMDICFTSNWTNNFMYNVNKGAFLPLNELLDKYAPNLMNTVPQKAWNGVKVNGQIYGVVNYQIACQQRGIWLRKDLVDKYKFDVSSIKKWYDIEPFLKLIKENEPNIYPLESTAFWSVAAADEGLAYAGIDGSGILMYNLKDSEIKLMNRLDLPEYKNYLGIVGEWYRKGYTRSDIAIVKDFDPDRKAGKVAAGATATVKPSGTSEFKAKYGYDVVEVKIGDPLMDQYSVTSTINAITKNSTNPQVAIKLLEMMNSNKQLYNLISFGIEGKHYTKVSENKIDKPKDSKYSASNWVFGCVFNSFLNKDDPDNVWEETKKMNDEAIESPLLGFVPDLDNLKTQITQVDSASTEYAMGLETGMVNANEFLPKFADKLNKAEIGKITEEVQKQINEWKNNK